VATLSCPFITKQPIFSRKSRIHAVNDINLQRYRQNNVANVGNLMWLFTDLTPLLTHKKNVRFSCGGDNRIWQPHSQSIAIPNL